MRCPIRLWLRLTTIDPLLEALTPIAIVVASGHLDHNERRVQLQPMFYSWSGTTVVYSPERLVPILEISDTSYV